jgi:hypothetical protein
MCLDDCESVVYYDEKEGTVQCMNTACSIRVFEFSEI